MMTIKINQSELKICESTANAAVTKLDASSIKEIVNLINDRNYTCRVIYSKDGLGIKLAEQVGGEPTSSYDRLYAYISNFS